MAKTSETLRSIIAQQGTHTLPVRLDAFMTQAFSGEYTRSFLAQQIENGLVTVNGVCVKKSSHKIHDGDEINLTLVPPPAYDVQAEKVAFDIVAQEPDFLIINKPAGLVVHHSHTAPDTPTLVHGLVYHFNEFEEFDDMQRPGIVHRLDKDTSGLLIIARNQQAQARFSDLFKNREITKIYYALVFGHPEKQGVIDMPIGRHPSLRHKMKAHGLNPREARTEFEVVTYYEDFSLVKIRLITGRTHQIRVHFASIGHPLLGDELYAKDPGKLIKRQALHAGHLEFSYQGKHYSYDADLPADLVRVLKLARKAETE